MSFIEELKRRNVFKVGAAYVVMAWLVAQGVDVFLDNFGAPDWVIKTILLLLVAGLPVALFFAWAFELTPEGIKKEKDVDRSQSITHETGRKLDYTIIAVLLVALSWFAWDKFAPADGGGPANTETTAAVEKSIAVLPFVNMSDDASNEYFSDGISEEILNALAKVKDLQVAGRTSSFAFKGQNQDLRQVGEALGVDHILEGSVRKAGNKVRVTAQLIQVDNGFHLWSESYDRELDDVFAIQDEISNAILQQLKAHLVGGEVEAVASQRTDSQAYDLYLLARQRIYERQQLPIESAAELLDQAIAIDPEYAPAYAQRSIAAHLLAENQYGRIPLKQSSSQSRLYFEQALRLDPELAEGWAAKGLWYLDRPGETDKGIAALEKALALNPNLIDAANWLNNAYNQSNQPAKALKILEDINRRDPLYRPAIGNLAFQYIQVGQREKARALIEKTRPFIAQDPNMAWLDSIMFSTAGEFAKASPLAETAMEQQPQDRVYRSSASMNWLETHQYERAADDGYWFVQANAMQHLGRVEEATLLAQKWADQGNVGELFRLLNATGRSTELVEYLESRWDSLDAFAIAFPSHGYFGWQEMLDVALAYQRAGNPEKFDDALFRIREAHDSLAEQGLSNTVFYTNEAIWHALAGERQKALQFLAKAIDGGRIYARRIVDDFPAFRELEGDPEYEAIQTRMIEHLNRERAALGLEPVSV
jgi:TolB-like protein/Tfp pilus assembly protein PilF